MKIVHYPHPALRHAGKPVLTIDKDLRLQIGARGCQRIVGHHQGTHGRHGFDHAAQAAGRLGAADGGMQGHHPAVDLGRYFVAEFDGEGSIAAGQVPDAHVC